MRLAWFGPLPPSSGAIAEFGRELLPALAQYAEIELWIDGAQPAPMEVPDFRVVRYGPGDPRLMRLISFDARLYQMSESMTPRTPLHDVACRYPGVVVLHESAEPQIADQHPMIVDGDAKALIRLVLSVATGLVVRSEGIAARVHDLCAGLPVATIPGCVAREYARFVERASGGIEPMRITLVERIVDELASMGVTERDTSLVEDFGDAIDRTLGDG
jgi:hypothetical protein